MSTGTLPAGHARRVGLLQVTRPHADGCAHRGVVAPAPYDRTLRIGPGLVPDEDAVPGTVSLPPAEQVVDPAPRPVLDGYVAPWDAGPGPDCTPSINYRRSQMGGRPTLVPFGNTGSCTAQAQPGRAGSAWLGFGRGGSQPQLRVTVCPRTIGRAARGEATVSATYLDMDSRLHTFRRRKRSGNGHARSARSTGDITNWRRHPPQHAGSGPVRRAGPAGSAEAR